MIRDMLLGVPIKIVTPRSISVLMIIIIARIFFRSGVIFI